MDEPPATKTSSKEVPQSYQNQFSCLFSLQSITKHSCHLFLYYQEKEDAQLVKVHKISVLFFSSLGFALCWL